MRAVLSHAQTLCSLTYCNPPGSAFAIRYRDRAQTLNDAAVNTAHQAILDALKNRFGAELR